MGVHMTTSSLLDTHTAKEHHINGGDHRHEHSLVFSLFVSEKRTSHQRRGIRRGGGERGGAGGGRRYKEKQNNLS